MNDQYRDYKSNLDKMYGNGVEGENGTIRYLDNKKIYILEQKTGSYIEYLKKTEIYDGYLLTEKRSSDIQKTELSEQLDTN